MNCYPDSLLRLTWKFGQEELLWNSFNMFLKLITNILYKKVKYSIPLHEKYDVSTETIF